MSAGARLDKRRARIEKRVARDQKRGDARHTAEDRRAEVLTAAVAEFAIHGLHGTSTEAIAGRIGISQPYIFRLFPSKKELFLGAIDQCFDRVEASFEQAVKEPETTNHQGRHFGESAVGARMHAMGHAYIRLLARREVLLFQMQAYAACSEDDVRSKVRQRWERLMKRTAELSGATPEELPSFFASGMLMNVLVAIGMVPDKARDAWAHDTLGFA
ncbi:MAG TPA: TetR/AcrR family transcriptional regulator [Candidatus Dormibacteraeota bacterium]|nr:TetR/AcrR family transcriptional regulator [Candidatus Dormibacteraeota bacterium]